MALTSHEINLYGLSGSIFWTILIGFIFYVLGFATVGWSLNENQWSGLWLTCTSNNINNADDALRATQAMITIGLILFVASCIAIFVYMFIHNLSYSKAILIKVFCGLSFSAVLFILIGVAVYGGTRKTNLNWSYAFTVIGGIFCLTSAVLSVIHMKKSSVF